MARVPYVTREDLTQEHQAAYDRIANTRGAVGPNFQGPLDESLAISKELGMRPLMERVLSRREILKA